MIHICVAILLVASTSALPTTLCDDNYYLYRQCLPSYDWVCPSKPKDFTINSRVIRTELRKNPKWLYDLFTNKDCMHDVKPYIPPMHELKYRKTPACNTVRELVEYVYRDIKHPLTDVAMGTETCKVIYSNKADGPVLQEIYKVSCHGKSRKNPMCDIGYSGMERLYCKPTNLVARTILVYCPSDNGHLRDMVVKIPTACSCVNVSCANETYIPTYSNEGRLYPSQGGGNPLNVYFDAQASGFSYQSLDYPAGKNPNQNGPIFHPLEDPHLGSGPIPHLGSGQMPHSGSGPMPHLGSGSMQHLGSGSMPHSGSGSIPHSESGSMPHSGSGPMPHSGSGPMLHSGSGSMPHSGSGPMPHSGSGPMPHSGSGSMPHSGSGPMPHSGSGPIHPDADLHKSPKPGGWKA